MAILGIIFLGEFGFLILLDLGLWQFKPHTRPTSTNHLIEWLKVVKNLTRGPPTFLLIRERRVRGWVFELGFIINIKEFGIRIVLQI